MHVRILISPILTLSFALADAPGSVGEKGHFPKSHQQQLVDRSSPTYLRRFAVTFVNPTNGSWWIVQVQPTFVEGDRSWIDCGGNTQKCLRIRRP